MGSLTPSARVRREPAPARLHRLSCRLPPTPVPRGTRWESENVLSPCSRPHMASRPPSTRLLHWESEDVPPRPQSPACQGGSQRTCLAWRPYHRDERESAHVSTASCIPDRSNREPAHVPVVPRERKRESAHVLSCLPSPFHPPGGSHCTWIRHSARIVWTQVGVRERGSAHSRRPPAWESEHVSFPLRRHLCALGTGVRARVLPRARPCVGTAGVRTRAFPRPRTGPEDPKVGVRRRELAPLDAVSGVTARAFPSPSSRIGSQNTRLRAPPAPVHRR